MRVVGGKKNLISSIVLFLLRENFQIDPVNDVICGSPNPATADNDEDHDDDQDGRQGVGRLRVVQHVRAQHQRDLSPAKKPVLIRF